MSKRSIEATCPECRGPLSLHEKDGPTEVRCLVGHAYTPKGVLLAHSEAEEKALWAGVVALEEASTLVDSLAHLLPEEAIPALRELVARKKAQAVRVRELIAELEPFRL